jgi:ribosome maturation factor RimP
MSKASIIEALVREPLEKLGLEVVEVEYQREAGDRMLRIYIDREAGVDLETCSNASRAVKALIDETEIDYDHMEVSSPGLNRVIKTDRDLQRFNGENVSIKTVQAYEGPRKIVGRLQGFGAADIKIMNQENRLISIPRDMISIIRLHPEF